MSTTSHPHPSSDALFLADRILADDPVGPDGTPLEVLHDREYRVRTYRASEDTITIRGAVRDQKPPGLYFGGDPDPITVHHMQVDLDVRLPSLEIVRAEVTFNSFPNDTCPAIVDHYDRLVGLSIARGFTHRIRELFGGPRGCTHTTALLQAMAPVAVQTIWSVAASEVRRAERDGTDPSNEGSPEDAGGDMWKRNVNTCHVWDADGETVAELRAGTVRVQAPRFARERMAELGLEPQDWFRPVRGGVADAGDLPD